MRRVLFSLNCQVMENCFPPGRRRFSVQRVHFAYIRGACRPEHDWQKPFANSLHTGHHSSYLTGDSGVNDIARTESGQGVQM